MRLHTLLLDAASAGLADQSPDGSMPPGHNGPYHDPETPVRNTGHWLQTFATAYHLSGEGRYLEASRRAADYLLRPELRPAGATFWHRSSQGKDRCNGLVGQAWTIEALVEAAATLGMDECRQLARSVFLLHPFDERTGLWQRVEVDGSVLSEDPAFNHQLWFAAAGSLVMDTDPLIARRVRRFLDRLPRNLHLYSSGLVYHDLGDLVGRLTNRPIRRLQRQLLAVARHASSSSPNGSIRLHDPRYRKAIGYHGFNLYAFALLRQRLPGHPFWPSGRMRRMLAYTTTDEFRAGLESNKYGYPYNPAGFEVAFALHVFADVAAPGGGRAVAGVGARTAAPHVRRRAAPAGPQHRRPRHPRRAGVRGHPAARRRGRELKGATRGAPLRPSSNLHGSSSRGLTNSPDACSTRQGGRRDEEKVRTMKGKPALVIGGLVAALAIPTGVAVAATTTPSPSPSTGTNPGYGPGMRYGRMMGGGSGDPQDCPFSTSTEAQQWRSQRQQRRTLEPAQRQKLMQQHREQMRNLRSRGATP